MKIIHCVTPSREELVLRQTGDGMYCCPVCGRAEFAIPPYDTKGAPSFEMCSCGFEFGFDDSPRASADAVDGIQENWKRWRNRLIEKAAHKRNELEALEASLAQIDIRLAFDLIPVEERQNEST